MGIFDSDAKRQKLLDKKRQWAEEGRLLTGKTGLRGRDRLPPGQHEVKNWPVLDLGVQPMIDRNKWHVTIDGLVENPVTWDWLEFFTQPQVNWVSDIHCGTAWSRYDNEWMGVSAAHILSVVKPLPDARYLMLHSQDSYTTNLTLQQFSDEDVLLAHSWQGELLPREHGGPVRAIVPQFYFWKSAKWLKRIEFIAEDKLGYWENRGYHNSGDPWKEERYSR
ncbi:MAG: sulfite oxidase-like oxidoreductase [Alphaproteobacteria bacterium]|nr:sulfite oxidase-like oxidoreductase [Alphaproteobacteria bacterium]